MKNKVLAIDIETFSEVDLLRSGVYPYAESHTFEILLFAYAFDHEEVRVVDLACGDEIPEEVIMALKDDTVIKTAFNANFERVCLGKFLNVNLNPKSWRCTEVQGAILGLPLSLDGASKVLSLTVEKMKEGKDLIKYFSMPCKPTNANGNRTRNYPHHNKLKWYRFKEYCKRDVEVERAIRIKLEKYPISDEEQEIYALDQEINDRGVAVDMKLVVNAMECDCINKDKLLLQLRHITGLSNPNSVSQLKQWLSNEGIEVSGLAKKDVESLIKENSGHVEEVLKLRLQLAKTSVKKYEAIERAVCKDGRVRGLFQFYGANRTGRWAGRLVQVQNLPQNHIKDLTLARELVRNGDFEDLELFYESVPSVLSELIRTALVPKECCKFIVADFSAIEARVIAWLANETWRINVFATHGKIYEASASHMFGVPIEDITKGSPLRQKGKIAELALAYGGAVGALEAMGALDMGLGEHELKELVASWRLANQNITKLWWDIDKASRKVVKEKTFAQVGRIKFYYESGIMFIQLPSGRTLGYLRPRLEKNKFGMESITYEGIGITKSYERLETYGAKICENICQGISRDILAYAMVNIKKKNYEIVMHVHDEIIVETPKNIGSLQELCDIMTVTPPWAQGLLLRADGFQCDFYKKD